MFWYYLQSRTNKALLISKNRRPFRWGEDVYILYFLCVSVLSVYPKVLAVRKTEMCGSSARNWQRHLSGCWKGLISFRCPGTVHLLIKQKNCSDFSCPFSLPQTAATPTPTSWDCTLEGFLLFLIPLSVKRTRAALGWTFYWWCFRRTPRNAHIQGCCWGFLPW